MLFVVCWVVAMGYLVLNFNQVNSIFKWGMLFSLSIFSPTSRNLFTYKKYKKNTKNIISLLTPSQVIIKLHNDEYKFTQTDIDKFLLNALYSYTNRYLGYLFEDPYYISNERKRAVDIMLSVQQLSYDNVQLIITKISSTYCTYNYKHSLYEYMCILYKINKSGYIYHENQIKDLIDKGFYKLIKIIYSVKFMSINIFILLKTEPLYKI